MSKANGKKKKPKRGAPVSLTDAQAATIVETIAMSVRYSTACVAAGVAESTALRWRQRSEGRHDELGPMPELVGFLEAVKRAEGEGEKNLLLTIKKASLEGTWTASAWMLERLWPERYGKLERQLVEGRHLHKVEVEFINGPIGAPNSDTKSNGSPNGRHRITGPQ